MNRKEFLKKSVLGAAGIGIAGKVAANASKASENVGFNHLPNKEIVTANSVYHPANSRGMADHGWLKAKHTFSFANYYNPKRTNFGVLRVLNDDQIAPAKGFGMHPHKDMEIITIPLSGDLEHQDNMGNKSVIHAGEVQVMSAGTGIYHSEYNARKDKDVQLLQIWLFPKKKNVTPRYDQIKLNDGESNNRWQQILSPSPDDAGVWIHQNAWFHLTVLQTDKSLSYNLKKPGNGLYFFIIEGAIKINGKELNRRDGFGLWNANNAKIESLTNSNVLLMEVPMHL